MSLIAAIDLGTSGTRAVAVGSDGSVVASARIDGGDERRADGTIDARGWIARAETTLEALGAALREAGRAIGEVSRLTVDGTSGSVTLTDASGSPIAPGLLYDSPHPTASARAEALLPHADRPAWIAHQADLVLWHLGAERGLTDPNNALKTGHDPETGWPDALRVGPLGPLLPSVRTLHAELGTASEAGRRLGLREDCTIHAGTTDSIAAFLASGASEVGEAVTSLGSTLVLKLVSPVRVDDPARGIYSHRLGGVWLAGGASNAGGAGLAAALPGADLAALSARMDPDDPTGLDLYPLPRPGERFPVADPLMAPRLEPRPPDDARFLQAMLEGLARIEATGYAALAALGAPRVARVMTAGGGAGNAAWTAIRERALGVPVGPAPETDAATGLARALARHSARSDGGVS